MKEKGRDCHWDLDRKWMNESGGVNVKRKQVGEEKEEEELEKFEN